MSFDVYLERDGCTVEVEPHQEGGTYVFGGTPLAELNVTYNYSEFFYKHLSMGEGLRWLNGKTAEHTIEPLELAVTQLGTDVSADYWASTPGNAGHALSVLLSWAKQNQDATWKVL